MLAPNTIKLHVCIIYCDHLIKLMRRGTQVVDANYETYIIKKPWQYLVYIIFVDMSVDKTYSPIKKHHGE